MSAAPAPLRIGLLLDEPTIPWWIAGALESIQHNGLGDVVLAVLRAPEPVAKQIPRPLRWWRNRRVLGFALLDRLDRRRLRREATVSDASLETVCPRAARLVVKAEGTRFSDTILPEDVERIRGHDLDVMLRLGFRILRGPILRAARDGVWSFHHGDNRTNRGGPAGVWEVLEDRPESGVTLQRLTEELDGGQVLAWSVCATQRFSFALNERYLLRHSDAILLRSLERLHAGLDPCQIPKEDRHQWSAYAEPLYRLPVNRELRRHAVRLLWKYLRGRMAGRGRKVQWSIAWHWRDTPTEDDPYGILHRYREIPTPRDRYRADPFVVRAGLRWWMFFEEFPYHTARGEIAVWEMGPNGPIGSPTTVLSSMHHLSYPFVFEHEGLWYMVPESGEANRLDLYVAQEFPHRWSLHSTLMEGSPLFDATLLAHEGSWYLFASVGRTRLEATEELCAFVGDSPFGPFAPHPANPLVRDARRARMAGRFFRSGGGLFRPAQRCVPGYGAGVVVHQVLDLSPTTYRECVVHDLEPRWKKGLIGFHTLNGAGGLSVIDCLRLIHR